MLCVILRGPAAAGKSTISKALIRRLGSDAAYLHLDIIESEYNPASTTQFRTSLTNALRHKYVVGEMFYGDSHTTNPKWLEEFRKRAYCIVSIVLGVTFATSYERWNKDPSRNHNEDIKPDFDRFAQRQKSDIFAKASGLKEVLIDTENKTIEIICDEIVAKINEIYPNSI